MNRLKIVFLAACLLFAAHVAALSQTDKTKTTLISDKQGAQAVKSSAAYSEVLAQKTELTAEMESLLLDYTEEYPKVKELRFETGLLQKDLDKLLTVADASKLNLSLGRLMVRRAELAKNLWNLQKQYTDEDPNVKRAKRKVEIFEQAIKEILP